MTIAAMVLALGGKVFDFRYCEGLRMPAYPENVRSPG